MKTVIFSCTFIFISIIIFSFNKSESASPTPAAAPSISSFSPTNDSAGGTVTIVGINFSATITDNQVVFNGIVATILSATATTLQVIVPNGLPASSVITVKTSGQTATSTNSFAFVPAQELLFREVVL